MNLKVHQNVVGQLAKSKRYKSTETNPSLKSSLLTLPYAERANGEIHSM